MELATGRQGKPHITSQQDRQKHQGIFGDGAYILNTGNMLAPEVQSSNKIHIKDGALMFQGALFTVKVGTYDEVTINNGNQGIKRKDLIVARYTYDSSNNIEAGEWAVIQGTPAADNPVVPEVTSGDIQMGDSVVECPVFVVNLDGINVTGVDIIPDIAPTMSDLISNLSYSGTETRAGTWFGVPLYKKTFYIAQLPNKSSIKISISPIVPKNIRKIEGIGINMSEGAYQLQFFHPSDTYGVVLQAIDNYLEIVTYNDKTANSAYITLYYIKDVLLQFPYNH